MSANAAPPLPATAELNRGNPFRGNKREAALERNRIFRFCFWTWQFPDRIDLQHPLEGLFGPVFGKLSSGWPSGPGGFQRGSCLFPVFLHA